jgi:hypothetical protein
VTERQLGNLVETLARNPKARIVVVEPDLYRQKFVFTQIRELIRMHAILKTELVIEDQAWELFVTGAGRDPSVRVVIPNGSIPMGRIDFVVLDEVVDDPKDVWLSGVVKSRLVPGGKVEVTRG